MPFIIMMIALGYLNFIYMFTSDERVFPSGFEDSADKKKQITRQETGSNGRPKAEIKKKFFKTHLRKHENDVFGDVSVYTRRARSSFVSYLQLFENCLPT